MYLVVCPLKLEWKLLTEKLKKHGYQGLKQQNQGQWYYDFPDLDAKISLGSPGQENFFKSVENWLAFFPNTQTVVTVGSAGALNKHMQIGDVVFANEISNYDFQQNTIHFQLQKLDWPLNISRQIQTLNQGFQLHFAGVTSGDETVDDWQKAQELNRVTGALAVTWESAGGLKAAREFQKDYFEIRGITDFANDEVKSDFNKNIDRAIANCGEVLIQLLSLP